MLGGGRYALTSCALVAALLLASLSLPADAGAWTGDFFDGAASGQAVYEDMAIHPQAVRHGASIYVVYQGALLDPWIVAFDDDGTIRGPFKVGINPLSSGRDPDDSHGAPSLLVDPGSGDLHVFWGAHASTLMHAKTIVPGDISAWTLAPSVPGKVTYPQVFSDTSGVAHLFYRTDQNTDGLPDELSSTLDRGGWLHATSADGGSTWTTPTVAVRGTPEVSWYAHFDTGPSGDIHLALTALERGANSPFARSGVWYARMDPDDGLWRDATGASVEASPAAGLTLADLENPATACSVVATSAPGYQNQLSVEEGPFGSVGLMFVSGEGYGPEAFTWNFARFAEGGWSVSPFAVTDHFMDSGAFEYTADGIEAFITAGGSLGQGNDADRYVDRGGDIQRWTSEDGGSWEYAESLTQADPDRGVVYNDPQIVQGHDAGSRLLFGEWNNDAGAFVHKVYLWGEDGFRGREFFPDTMRISGDNRYGVAVAASKEAFPNGSDTVIVAGGVDFPDALAGGPLAEAYRAPLLLTPPSKASTSVIAEIGRLKARNLIVLGGKASVSDAVVKAYTVSRISSVRRISGTDRYTTAAAIAAELAAKTGRKPATAFVASGEVFADALAASPIASARGVPILLARRSQLPTPTAAALTSLAVSRTVVIGGAATIEESVTASLPVPVRIAGEDRYQTGALVARAGLDGIPGWLPGVLRTDRIVVASGEVFPDALAGGVLAARLRAPIVLTQGTQLTDAAAVLLDERAYHVMRCYLLGGERTLDATVAASVAASLQERQER